MTARNNPPAPSRFGPIVPPPVTNETRRAIAQACLDHYRAVRGEGNAPDQEDLIDLIADLCHLIESKHLCPEGILDTAVQHWTDEAQPPGGIEVGPDGTYPGVEYDVLIETLGLDAAEGVLAARRRAAWRSAAKGK